MIGWWIAAWAAPHNEPLEIGEEAARIPLETIDVLLLLTGRDGLTLDRERADERLLSLCTRGGAAACALTAIHLSDRGAIEAALAPLCEAGDAVACLGAALPRLPLSLLGLPPFRARDALFVNRVSAACDAGIARGCTELGFAYDAGWVDYPNHGAAVALWETSCEQQERRACTALARNEEQLRALAQAGEPVARLAVADTADDDEQLCSDGAIRGCFQLAARTAALPEPSRAVVETACQDGDLAACALLTQLDAAAGTIPVAEAISALESACPLVDSACEEAAFLAQGAPAVGGYPETTLHPSDTGRALFNVTPMLHRCLLEALGRDPRAEGWIEAVLRLSPEGTVDGVYLRNPFDDAYNSCATEALETATIRTRGVPTRVVLHIPAFHGATFEISPYGQGDAAGEAARLAEDTARWMLPFDACALRAGPQIAGETIALELLAHRDGSLTNVAVIDGGREPLVEACIVDWLTTHTIADPVEINTQMRVTAELLAPCIPERRDDASSKSEPVLDEDQSGEAVEINLLVLAVDRSRVDGRRAHLTSKANRSIVHAHEEMEAEIARMTNGKLLVHSTFRSLDTILLMGALDDGDVGFRRYNISPNNLPWSVWSAVEPGRWDSVFVWGAIPRGFPRPALGVTYGGVTIGGATLSSGVIPTGLALHENPGVPAYGLPLHEWWHQVEQRAAGYLGIGDAWPPRNHQPLRVGDRVLDPRTWLDTREETAIDWYRHVLGSMPRAFWEDVWSDGERIAIHEDNLAFKGHMLGEGVYDIYGLADGVLSFGAYPPPMTDPVKEAPWFGMMWWLPREVARVVVHIDKDAAAAWENVEIEELSMPSFSVLARSDGLSDAPWTPLDAKRVTDGETLTFTFPARELAAIRLVLHTNKNPASEGIVCREIEVYAR